MKCFHCTVTDEEGEVIEVYKGREEFFCSNCAKKIYM